MKQQKKLSLMRRNWFLKPKNMILTVAGSVAVLTTMYLVVRVCTMDTTLIATLGYTVPTFDSLEELPDLGYGDYAVAIDGVIAKKTTDGPKNMPTASTAKMILGLAIMRAKPFALGESGETITINDEMYNRYLYYRNNNGSNTRVILGEEISEYDALMSVFLASSNNMADALAIWAFGSLDGYREFATKMLNDLDIRDTTIGVDASGFDASSTSTASDLALIGQEVLKNPVLSEIVKTSEYEVPVAGLIQNTNLTLGRNKIVGVKTGYIGDASGYCLVSGYLDGEHIITVALLGAPTRTQSFNDSLEIVANLQSKVYSHTLLKAGETVGQYYSWWTGVVPIRATEDVDAIGWDGASISTALEMDGKEGELRITIGGADYIAPVVADEYTETPNLGEKLMHVFGWTLQNEIVENGDHEATSTEDAPEVVAETIKEENIIYDDVSSVSNMENSNCTLRYGYLMLINPNFTVTTNFIDARKSELVSVSSLYGIVEGNPYNGDNLLDAEAAVYLNEMVKAYEAEYPGHTFETRSCYRARGTTCGRLCAATGASDHHTGLTCDLLDPAYGTSLDTGTYSQHVDWQWLYANSYKYGFIDRFPEEWAGGSMSEPLNVDEYGSTGLFETWHYRYVGVTPATEIATGKYNDGEYDSLEHYLKARGMVTDLKNGKCD